jgi:transcriptional regulator with XRE-family HTH domain
MNTSQTPRPGESLADYLVRIRKFKQMTQFELATAAGIHSRSVGKIERELTTKLNQKTLRGLAVALGVPQEFLEAVSKGQEVQLAQSVKFC